MLSLKFSQLTTIVYQIMTIRLHHLIRMVMTVLMIRIMKYRLPLCRMKLIITMTLLKIH